MASNPIAIPNVGVSGTFTVADSDRIREVQRDVVVWDRRSSPLMTWLSMTKGRLRQTSQTLFEWYENQYDTGTLTITGGFTGGAATENVLITSSTVIENDTFCEPITNQFFICSAIIDRSTPGSTNSTLKLLPTGSNITAVAGPVTLVNCGNNMMENGSFPDAKGTRPTQMTNTVTKQAASIEVTEEEFHSPNYWGNKWFTDKEAAITQFRKDMERNLLFSKFYVETNYSQTNTLASARTGTLRGTRGLLNTISTNVQSYSGKCTVAVVRQWLRTAVWPRKYSGSSTKMTLWGPDALNDFIADLGDKIRITTMGRQLYGLDIYEFLFMGNFRILFMLEPEFYEVSPYVKGIVAVDPNNMFLRNGPVPEFMSISNTTLPRVTTMSIGMKSQTGLQYQMETSGAVLKQPS